MTTILIIDDSMLARKLVSNAVASAQPDWSVRQAANGEEALKVAADNPPDLAIIDYNMPGVDGVVLAGLLRERFPRLRVGILTANVQDALRRKVAELGYQFMDKPITPDKLRDLLALMAVP